MRYKHIFFDLDRTLWDFETNSFETLSELYEKYRLDQKGIVSPNEFVKKYKTHNDLLWEQYREGSIDRATLRVDRFHKTLADFDIEDVALSYNIGNDYIEHSPRKTALMPHAHDVLSYLHEKYSLHIITNGFEEVQHIKIDHSDLKKYFREIITSERAGYKKPEKFIFDYSLETANARAEESIMIGDHLEIDLLGARNAGIDQVYFNPNNVPHTETITHEISSLKELLEIL